MSKKSKIAYFLACLLWVFSIGLGLYFLMQHEATPGKPAFPPVKFPKDTKLKLSSDKDTLVMFIHPLCPCTKASLNQLAPLSQNQNLEIKIVHFKPSHIPLGWSEKWKLDDWTKQKSVQIIEDTDGVEAKRFNSKTSGQVFLFAKNGNLIFDGGITRARGVDGENAGFDSLKKALLRDKSKPFYMSKVNKSVVFGCNLLNERN